MSLNLNPSFTRAIERSIDDCSNPFQLRACMNRFRNYLCVEYVRRLYLKKLAILGEYFAGDSISLSTIEDLKEDLDIEVQISEVCSSNMVSSNFKENDSSIVYVPNINENDIYMTDFSHNSDHECLTLKALFSAMNGNKLFICRFLDCSPQLLNKKINQYKLKEFLNDIRRNFRTNIKKKIRS